MINKELMIGGAAAVLTVVGLYYAMKSNNANDQQTTSANTPTSAYGYLPYSSYGGSAASVPTSSGVTLSTAQTGDLTAVLQTNSETQKLNAQTAYTVGVLGAINAQSATVLARGNDLAGRGNGTLELNYNQQTTSTGVPTATGTTTQAPITTQMTAHLTETVPDQHYAPLPPPAPIIVPPAPVIVQQPAPSGGGGGCFITTVICQLDGKPDDCDELTTLRKFRDDVMMTRDDLRAMVKQYYDEAPAIANALKTVHLIYLKFTYLLPAVAAVKQGDNEKALKLYTQLFTTAKKFVV